MTLSMVKSAKNFSSVLIAAVTRAYSRVLARYGRRRPYSTPSTAVDCDGTYANARDGLKDVTLLARRAVLPWSYN